MWIPIIIEQTDKLTRISLPLLTFSSTGSLLVPIWECLDAIKETLVSKCCCSLITVCMFTVCKLQCIVAQLIIEVL